MPIPPVVSKRNEFTSVAELVAEAVRRVPNELKHENLGAWLLQYTKYVVRAVAHSFSVGAERGVEQTATLLQDPEFYETRKRKHERATKKWREEQAQQRWEIIQEKECPTAEQIERQIARCDGQIAYHQKQIEELQNELTRLHGKTPSKVRQVSQLAN